MREDSSVTIQPCNDRVLIRRIAEPEKVGSIYMPDVAREKAIKGMILAVGPLCEVKPGQQCYFNSNWDDSDGALDTQLHLVQEADIFGLIAEA